MVPVGVPLFRRNENLLVIWRVYGAPQIEQEQGRVLDQRGEPLPIDVTINKFTGEDHLMVGLSAALSAVAPGDYLLEFTAKRGAKSLRRLVAFRVTP